MSKFVTGGPRPGLVSTMKGLGVIGDVITVVSEAYNEREAAEREKREFDYGRFSWNTTLTISGFTGGYQAGQAMRQDWNDGVVDLFEKEMAAYQGANRAKIRLKTRSS